MINYRQFKQYAVRPITKHFPTPVKAEQCLMAFAAHESLGGTYMQQIRGPAMGPYQMEPPTKNLVDRWVRLSQPDATKAPFIWARGTYHNAPLDELRTDLKCATWYARLLLLADPHPLPKLEDWDAVYETYLRVWRPGKPPTKAQFKQAHVRWMRA
tara:strand:+ start:7555 stop:8022 length:468 start_codon:yes stop_codon:yes gene_type:complete